MIRTVRNPDGTTTTTVDQPTAPATQPAGVRIELVDPTDRDAVRAWQHGTYPADRAIALVDNPDPEKD
jgi:hypothetical protein